MTGSTVLADVLAAVRAGLPPAAVAGRLGLDADEVAAAIGYWVHTGALTVTAVDCAGPGCGDCPVRSAGCAPGATRTAGPRRHASRASGGMRGPTERTSINVLTT